MIFLQNYTFFWFIALLLTSKGLLKIAEKTGVVNSRQRKKTLESRVFEKKLYLCTLKFADMIAIYKSSHIVFAWGDIHPFAPRI